jgi:tetratricopeptide (TPR) repeat protein
MEQGKLDDAAKAFESAHVANYNAFAPRIHLADVFLRQKKFAEARKEYEKLLDLISSPVWPDYLRFGILMSYLGEHDQAHARQALAAILFPTETPAYYYAQAAWSFDHGKKSEALKWIDTAKKIFDSSRTGWFDRVLYQFGWLNKKPARSIDPSF